MKPPPHRYARRAASGIVAAIAIGFAVVAICNTVWALATGFPIATRWNDASVTQVGLASLPYLILAICGIDARRAWGTGLCLTTAFWGFYLWVIIYHQRPDANIGLGMLMMFSPFPIAAGSLLALARGRKTGAG